MPPEQNHADHPGHSNDQPNTSDHQHHPDLSRVYPSTDQVSGAPEHFDNQPNTDTASPPNQSFQNSSPSLTFDQPSVANTITQPSTNNAGVMVLQWLTYAFWGWTVLGLSILTSLIINSFIGNSDNSNFTLYSLAAVLVLLPVSFICESLYRKKEPPKKTGAELAIMAIHAVIFALFGIGALIVAAFSVVTMFTSSSSSNTSQVSLYSSLIVTVYYAATFLRTINFSGLPWIAKYYRFFMLITIGIMAVLGIVGPMAKERATRTDRLIESNISNIVTAINGYATNKKTLPNKLSDLSLNGDTEKLVNDNLVEYKKESVNSVDVSDNSLNDKYESYSLAYNQVTLKYQLCVTYKEKSANSRANYEESYSATGSSYTTYVSAYNHEAGNVCYKLKTGY